LPLPLALSIGFTHPDANEESVQRGVATQLGLPQHFVWLEELVDQRGIVRESLELAATFPTITANTWQPSYNRLGVLGRQAGTDVILTGSGGDEWLGVTPYYAYDLLRQGQFSGLWHLWSTYARSLKISLPHSTYNLLWRFGARPLIGDAGAAVLSQVAPGLLRTRHRRLWLDKWPPWLAPDPELRAQLDARVDRLIEEQNERRRIKSYYTRELWAGITHPLISNDHEIAFEEGRRMGAPKLSPFHSASVVRFLLRVPPELLNRGNLTKGLVRWQLAQRFPELGFDRQKKVLTTRFFEEAIFPESRQLWAETGQGKALADAGIVDRRGLLHHLEQLSPSNQRSQWHLLYLLHVDHWLRTRVASNRLVDHRVNTH
jgi:asparagine synthetase B (glutamine-hydrolysing)